MRNGTAGRFSSVLAVLSPVDGTIWSMTSTDRVEPKERHPFWMVVFWLRRLAIGLLLVWGVGVVLFGDSLTVCGEQLADAGEAVEVCEALTLMDPPVLLFLLILLVLLLPEAAEVEVAGLFRIKRQLEEAEQDVAGLRQSVSALQSQVASAAATSRSSAHNTTTVIVDRAAETGGVAAGEAPSVDESGDVGVGPAAVLAFKAAFEGLTTLLPASFPTAELVGFTLQSDGAPVASSRTPSSNGRRTSQTAQVLGWLLTSPTASD
ncbi:hypothetical protein [Nocardioides nanhaiensis]|uniref:Uncharacterized protein n=1 Tax=Nocardioides nanhaiensis TaxID=1476871 RepID=A0ABP8VZF9_9ACTN